MSRFDLVVVGGGVVGLAVAFAALERNRRVRVVVVEKEDACARHQSGRNSGVVHSGIYYKPGSLKAQLCREGRERLQRFCAEHGVPYEQCGKVIVATAPEELPRLRSLHARGLANGVPVRMLTAAEVSAIEPHVTCLEGLHVPSTAIVDYNGVCRKLVELIRLHGGEVRVDTEVVNVRTEGGRAIVETTTGTLHSRWIVNCAGLHSDRVAQLAGFKLEARIVPFRGEYYELKPDRCALVNALVYPVPDPNFPFLGVHFTRMIDGRVHAGPNAVLSLKREGYHRTAFNARDFIDTVTYQGFWRLAARHAAAGWGEIYRSFSQRAFVHQLRRLIPAINEDDLVPAAAGVRAQALRPDGSLVDDFLILRGPATIHVCNAPSPAATAALEIGRRILALLTDDSSVVGKS